MKIECKKCGFVFETDLEDTPGPHLIECGVAGIEGGCGEEIPIIVEDRDNPLTTLQKEEAIQNMQRPGLAAKDIYMIALFKEAFEAATTIKPIGEIE